MPIATIISLLAGAVDIVGAFTGNAQAAKTTGYIQEALGTIAALTPLVQSFGSGTEVTIEDARTALAGSHTALAALDKAIEEAK